MQGLKGKDGAMEGNGGLWVSVKCRVFSPGSQ